MSVRQSSSPHSLNKVARGVGPPGMAQVEVVANFVHQVLHLPEGVLLPINDFPGARANPNAAATGKQVGELNTQGCKLAPQDGMPVANMQ